MRAWLRAGWLVCVASVLGCGGDNRESIISNTTTQISEAATSVGNIKSKVEEFVKKKEAETKDEEGAKKELEEAIAEAKKLKEIAKAMQILSMRALGTTPPTAEEKNALLEKNLSRINETTKQLIEAHRDLKQELAKASKKYEEPLRPLMQALNDAEGEFAKIGAPEVTPR